MFIVTIGLKDIGRHEKFQDALKQLYAEIVNACQKKTIVSLCLLKSANYVTWQPEKDPREYVLELDKIILLACLLGILDEKGGLTETPAAPPPSEIISFFTKHGQPHPTTRKN